MRASNTHPPPSNHDIRSTCLPPYRRSAAQRRLAHTVLSPQALEAARGPLSIGASEARLVCGLGGFLRQQPPPSPGLKSGEEEEGEEVEVGAARCKRLVRELEAMGALGYPPPACPSEGEGRGGDEGLTSLSEHMLSSLSLSLSSPATTPLPPPPQAPFAAGSTACPACGQLLEAEVLAGSGVCEYCGHEVVGLQEEEGEEGEEGEEVRWDVHGWMNVFENRTHLTSGPAHSHTFTYPFCHTHTHRPAASAAARAASSSAWTSASTHRRRNASSRQPSSPRWRCRREIRTTARWGRRGAWW